MSRNHHQLQTIGKRIRQARESKRLTQDELAEKVGLSGPYIGRLERGEKAPSIPTVVALAGALAVSANFLLGLEPLDKEKEKLKAQIKSLVDRL